MDYLAIILISLLLGGISGMIMHRADFCLAGMFRDLFLFRNSPHLRSLLLLIALSMLLFEMARLMGILNHTLPSSLYGLPSLTNLIGGVLFGLGMVLAGGCVVGTLYKVGAGSIPSASAFCGLIIGSTLYAEIHPAWKELAQLTRLGDAASLPQLLKAPPTAVLLMALVLMGFFLWRWWRLGKLELPSVIRHYLQPKKAAVLLAVIGLISFTLLGRPLGISTSYAKAGAFIEQIILPEHFATLSYFQGQGFHYFSPLCQRELTAGAGPFLDGLSLVQFPLIIGILLGSCISALSMGKFQLHFSIPRVQLLSALLGGVMMGLASHMTPSCNVWHLMGGLPLLSLQSLLFTLGLFPGAWLGTRILTRYVIK
ncbi:MAG: YeeE/YedE family protein [Desulfuromonadales bacterium]|nr:YeeE/YedE family protein [Desulfuromonadales bacterium]